MTDGLSVGEPLKHDDPCCAGGGSDERELSCPQQCSLSSVKRVLAVGDNAVDDVDHGSPGSPGRGLLERGSLRELHVPHLGAGEQSQRAIAAQYPMYLDPCRRLVRKRDAFYLLPVRSDALQSARKIDPEL